MINRYSVHLVARTGGTLFLGTLQGASPKDVQERVFRTLVSLGALPDELGKEMTTHSSIAFKNGNEVRIQKEPSIVDALHVALLASR